MKAKLQDEKKKKNTYYIHKETSKSLLFIYIYIKKHNQTNANAHIQEKKKKKSKNASRTSGYWVLEWLPQIATPPTSATGALRCLASIELALF